jgi:predicted nuclease of restriction endonuclease-like (RecB) superfamily
MCPLSPAWPGKKAIYLSIQISISNQPMSDFSVTNPEYGEFLAKLTHRVQSARMAAGRAVNRELVALYWDIGRDIVEKQRTQGWGNAVVERLGTDLRREFPGVTGFSADNLWRMRQFYLEGTGTEFLALFDSSAVGSFLEQLVPERQVAAVRELMALVPWGHHVELLKKVKTPDARLFYLREIARFGWSRAVLLHQIKASTFERSLREKKTHNFELALPDDMADQAEEMLKSRYNLEFLGMKQRMRERDLEQRLIERVQQFILELGYGFCYIGRQYRLALGEKEYFVDLLFYHRFLKALVAVDLKVRGFEPEHAGKMDFYLNVLNEKERASDDRPSIGIILCAEKNDVEVEFALKSKTNPIGVAEYRLQDNLPAEFKGKLPTAKQLADVVRGALPGDK